MLDFTGIADNSPNCALHECGRYIAQANIRSREASVVNNAL